MKSTRNLLLLGALTLATVAPRAHAALVFDNMSVYQGGGNTNAGISSTGSTPNTFMGAGYTVTPGTAAITGFDVYPVNLSGTAFTGLRLNLYVWGSVNTSGTVNSTTPAFSNLLGTYSTVATGTFSSGYYWSYEGNPVGSAPGITLPSPIAISGNTIGVTLNYQGTTDGVNYNNLNSLTSLISYGVAPSVGSLVFNGYYRNASSEVNGNFISSLRSLGKTDQGLALRIYGTAIPEPAAASLLGLGLAALVAFRRRNVA